MSGYDLIIPVYNEKNIIKLIDYIFINSKNFIKETSNTFSPSTPYAASKSAADMLTSVYQNQYEFPLFLTLPQR